MCTETPTLSWNTVKRLTDCNAEKPHRIDYYLNHKGWERDGVDGDCIVYTKGYETLCVPTRHTRENEGVMSASVLELAEEEEREPQEIVDRLLFGYDHHIVFLAGAPETSLFAARLDDPLDVLRRIVKQIGTPDKTFMLPSIHHPSHSYNLRLATKSWLEFNSEIVVPENMTVKADWALTLYGYKPNRNVNP